VDQQPVVTTDPDAPMTATELALRVTWIAVRIVAVLYLGQQGALFFYQAF
jgi:hypothetical protein